MAQATGTKAAGTKAGTGLRRIVSKPVAVLAAGTMLVTFGSAAQARVTRIVIDAQGNLYVADAGNQRIQVFDGDGNLKSQIQHVGVPSALCITSGASQ